MTRRNFIALVSVCVLVAIGAIVLGVAVFATQSDRGQTAMREWVQARVQSSIAGKAYVGRISGSFLTGVTIDSLNLRDEDDSLVIATGKITVQYDPRDLVDRRLYFSRVDIDHPAIVLRQHENWKWNYRKLFRIGGPPKTKVAVPERGFGDFVILDSVHINKGANFRLTIPWHADDSLHGVRRDSAINANVARKDHEIRRTREGLTQTYRWQNAYAFLSHIRIADPDSAGAFLVVDTLHTDESTPPFMWRNVKGVAKVLGDSAWTTITHFDLPGSTGTARGKVWWGSNLPVRYAMHIVGDSVSLADVDWVYPTLPTSGGGRMALEIRNERNLELLDFAVHDMDVRSTRSHILGAMTFEIGGPVLNVHDVKIVADPVDFDLLRTLNGKPFPADWQGKIRGTVTAKGGPLTHFRVDASNITFADAHVPGAISHVQGHGELDILFPAFTVFHGFSVTTDRLDIRTFPVIYPSFPRMKGIVAGSVMLDSSWLDVRVSNANLTLTDGPAEPSHATGGGRITYGIPFMTYDMSLQASPLSLTTLAESYPRFPLRGTLTGPVRVRGQADNLDITADLAGGAGHLTYNGKVDADSIGGYGAKGAGTFEALDGARLFGLASPKGQLAGTYDVNLLGDSLANLVGSLGIRVDPSSVEGLPIATGVSRMRFDNGILAVDTLHLEGAPGTLRAHGRLGLTRAPGGDSLTIAFGADSLGGWRRYLGRLSSSGRVVADSLAGAVAVRATVRGWLDSLEVRASLEGKGISVLGDHAEGVRGTLAITSLKQVMSGAIVLRGDTVLAGGLRLDTASISARVFDAQHARIAAGALTANGAALRTAADWHAHGDTTDVRVDTFNLSVGTSRWSLRRPSSFSTSAGGVRLDTLLFADASGARFSGFVDAPANAEARARLHADSVPLADVGLLAQLPSALAGKLTLDLDVGGTRDLPTMSIIANAPRLAYAGLRTDNVTFDGTYGANRANLRTNIERSGHSILDANLSYPVAVTLFSAHALDDSVRGRIHADSVELAIIEAFSPKLRNTSGRLALNLAISGVPGQMHLGGGATLRDGAIEAPDVGVRFTEMDGDVRVDAARDSLSLDSLRWTSPASGGSASLRGSLVYRDPRSLQLDLRLRASNLRAVDKRGLARLDVTTGANDLTLAGTHDAAVLSGEVQVARGTIYIPDILRKQVVDLTPEDFAQLFDTTDVRTRSLMPQPPSSLVEHLSLQGVSIRLGEDVWLRSREASIKLGGSLNVTRALDDRESTRSALSVGTNVPRYQLALSGALSADRGTYTLDLTAAQREFQVESGRITFYGTPDFNPQIDVTALYNVKQANRADIGIRARIHGNFYPQPALELSSTDAYLSPSDLVAYLVTGQPSSELSRQDVSGSQRALEFLVPTVGAKVSSVLREQLGGAVDLIQIQSGTVNDPLANANSSSGQFKSILSSTRLGGEKQISDKLFLSFSTGLCQIGGGAVDESSQGLAGFANAIEGKLEFRFPMVSPDRLSIRAGREPAASALRCGTQQVRGFVATPQQWGLSLFRSWSF